MSQESELDTSLPEFVEEMKKRIRKATFAYGDFTQYGIDGFVAHFRDEAVEMYNVLTLDAPCPECGHQRDRNIPFYDAVMHEALDVANLAYFLWWAARNAKI